MKATESASAFRIPWQPEVVVPGGTAVVLCRRMWPSWWVSAQMAWPSVEAGEDADAAGGPERGAVGRAAGLALDREAFSPGQPAQAVPQARQALPRRCGNRGRAGNGLPAGLGQVPDVGDTIGVAPAVVLLGVFMVATVAGCWRGPEKISMPFSSRFTCRPAERHASYPLTSVASGIRDEMSRTFAQVSVR